MRQLRLCLLCMLIVRIMYTLSFLVWLFWTQCVHTRTLSMFTHLMRKTPALHSVHIKIEMESYCMALDAVVRVRVRVRAWLYQMEIDRQTASQSKQVVESERDSGKIPYKWIHNSTFSNGDKLINWEVLLMYVLFVCFLLLLLFNLCFLLAAAAQFIMKNLTNYTLISHLQTPNSKMKWNFSGASNVLNIKAHAYCWYHCCIKSVCEKSKRWNSNTMKINA